jgi:hypothetical protein
VNSFNTASQVAFNLLWKNLIKKLISIPLANKWNQRIAPIRCMIHQENCWRIRWQNRKTSRKREGVLILRIWLPLCICWNTYFKWFSDLLIRKKQEDLAILMFIWWFCTRNLVFLFRLLLTIIAVSVSSDERGGMGMNLTIE